MRTALRTVLLNLVVLAVAILPLWFLLAWITGGRSDAEHGNPLSAFAVGYVFVILPLLVAGALQQILLVLCVRTNLRSRWLTVATVGVIPLTLGLISAPLNVQFSTRFVLATVVSLVTFGVAMRVPTAASGGSSSRA